MIDTNDDLQKMMASLSDEQIAEIKEKLTPTKVTFPDLALRGGPSLTLDNHKALFKFYGIKIRYNEMSKEAEVDIPGYTFHPDTRANAQISILRNFCHKQGLGVTELDGMVATVANENAYHPVREWLEGTVWDGVDRLPQYYDSVVLRDENPLKKTMMYKWALSAIAAVYHPNFSCEGVLTYQSKQGTGKTISIENMIPPVYHNIWNKDANVIDMGNKDSLIKPLSYWISELGELDATFRKSDIEALKGFITDKVDMIRPPYERKANKYSRRTVFYGTVNEGEFLQDAENRRFWVLAVEKFVHITLDHKQFWAQLKVCYDNVKDKIATAALREEHQEWGWFMSPAERAIMTPLQNVHKSADPIEEMLSTHCVPASEIINGSYMNVTEILTKITNGGKIQKKDLNIGGAWLKKHKYGQLSDNKKYYVQLQGLRQDNFNPVTGVDATLAARVAKLRKK